MSEEQAEYTKNKTIFRTMKNQDNPFVMMDRRPIENPKLSWKSKGILAYLLSRPDNWTVRIGDLIKRSTDKAFAIRAAIKELEAAGHLSRRAERDGQGKFIRFVFEVYELPFTNKPLSGFPQVGNPQVGNLHLNNTDLTDTSTNAGEVSKTFVLYESNIGPLTPMIADALQDAEKLYAQDWIDEAIFLAVKHNKRNWAYCEVILKRWKTEGKDDGKKLEPKKQTSPAPLKRDPEKKLVKPEMFHARS